MARAAGRSRKAWLAGEQSASGLRSARAGIDYRARNNNDAAGPVVAYEREA